MENSKWLQDLFNSPLGWFGSLCMIVMALALLTLYLLNLYKNHKALKDKVEENRAVLQGSLTSLDDNIKRITTSITDLSVNLAYVTGVVDNFNPRMEKRSPINLSDKGKDAVDEFGGYEILEKNWNVILKNLEENVCGKSEYDIQEYCLATATFEPEKFLKEDDINIIKQHAFEHGEQIQSYTRLLGIIIRDKYLSQKGMNDKDIEEECSQTENEKI